MLHFARPYVVTALLLRGDFVKFKQLHYTVTFHYEFPVFNEIGMKLLDTSRHIFPSSEKLWEQPSTGSYHPVGKGSPGIYWRFSWNCETEDLQNGGQHQSSTTPNCRPVAKNLNHFFSGPHGFASKFEINF
jgi:hypothetical protein